jgi:DNA-binding NarL/FixJ family response regulator
VSHCGRHVFTPQPHVGIYRSWRLEKAAQEDFVVRTHSAPGSILLLTSGELGWAGIREGLRNLVNPQVITEARTGREALSLANEHRPSLDLATALIGEVSTRALVQGLRGLLGPSSTIVVIANHLSAAEAASFARAGADGCLLWEDLTVELAAQLLALLLTHRIILQSRTLWAGMLQELFPATTGLPANVQLSPRELMVLWHLAHRLTHEQIAARESLSVRTVRRTIDQLQRKLNAPSAFLLGLRAAQIGLDEPSALTMSRAYRCR